MKKIDDAKSTTYVSENTITSVTSLEIQQLIDAAYNDPKQRARLCLHKNYHDTVHEMIIAFTNKSYLPPHRHLNKSESFHIIQGSIAVFFFDDLGNIKNSLELSGSKDSKPFMYRMDNSEWHTVLPLTNEVVLHEITAGPFDSSDVNIPSWAPSDDSDSEVSLFKDSLKHYLNK